MRCSNVCDCLVPADMEKWRVGRKLGRTVYVQHSNDGPCGQDFFLGMFDSADVAQLVVKVMNEWFASGNQRSPSTKDIPAPFAG